MGEKGRREEVKGQRVAAIHTSISFPSEVHETLETIAEEEKVSLARVVREAAKKYIVDRWPLFRQQG
ncbi:MAG: hypothetical protein KGM47_08405 [Acidobacteriota bacterium]|nr:hypothetical protein [Acidobacteriota bacterium]